ncbi:MAG: peptidoglycan DD-metalloendopeptidase family protein [Burkholderiales bacterium]|nr:peptidoglycan DD-metalloendopeptidase family protein [Burkholderiales bacterium]
MFRLAAGLLLAALFAGCASTPNRAPVEDRAIRGARSAAPAASGAGVAAPAGAGSAAEAAKPPPPGIENAGKPGYYTVKPGDTLIRIGLESGQNWRDIARWNSLESPYTIEVGQVVRVVPPAPVATTQPVAPGGARGEPRTTAAAPAASAGSANAATAAATAATVAAASPAAPRDPDDDVNWAWPAAGPVLTPFDDAKNKGLAIGGKAGDPVYAAADGRVVYAGSGLRGYGNLIIIKHNNTYLTAYAHNQALLVKEDQVVRRGQKIAEMGSSDSDRVQLHFEIRRQGKPIDPTKLLPPR